MSHEKYQNCIDACNACVVACEHCISGDLKEGGDKMMIDCINLNRECSVICRSSALVMSMGGKFSAEMCALCAKVCDACAAECEKHSHIEHCKNCAEACRNCLKALVVCHRVY
jgi:hypothetical protein